MYPLTKATTQYNMSALRNGTAEVHVLTSEENEEYFNVDDPKDGNASSANENEESEKLDKAKVQRLTKSAGPAMSYIRAQARRLSKEKKEKMPDNDSGNMSDDEDSVYSLPWRFVPSNILEDLEFFKNAGK